MSHWYILVRDHVAATRYDLARKSAAISSVGERTGNDRVESVTQSRRTWRQRTLALILVRCFVRDRNGRYYAPQEKNNDRI